MSGRHSGPVLLGVAASGRRPSGSERLLVEALEAAGGPRQVVRLAELSFRGCLGCRRCRSGAPACVQEDDLTAVLRDTAAARALVLATPVYYGYASGIFKSYLDRWYAFRDADRALRVPEGRPALLIVTQGNPDPLAYARTLGSLERVLKGYGLRPATLVAAGIEDAADLARQPRLLDRAREMGARLAAPPAP